MSKFDNQILNRAVSIKNLSQTNMNQFEHVHLTLNQLKSLYFNSKKINEISSDLIELERYLVNYQSNISQAQDHETEDERINQASHAADKQRLASSRAVKGSSASHEDQTKAKRSIEQHASHHTRTEKHSKRIKRQPRSWYKALVKFIERFLNKWFDNDDTNSNNSAKE